MSASTQGPAAVVRKSLALEIHAATRRHHHTSLNRLITSRLPLCLPPYAQDASVYTRGISAFAEIYFTFEQEWTSILSSSAIGVADDNTISPRIRNLLSTLHHPSLLRTARLKQDLCILCPQQTNHYSSISSALPGTTTTLTSYISNRIRRRPHTLLAYTWVMYLALFNGGRWIRYQLCSASASASTSSRAPHFWPGTRTAEECLTFWHFDGEHDGEDVKDGFKARFEAVTAQLSERERRQIVKEAIEVFKICGTVVEHLDSFFAVEADEKQNNDEDEKKKAKPPTDTSPLLILPLVASLTSQLWCIFAWVLALILPPSPPPPLDNPHPANILPASHGIITEMRPRDKRK